MNRPPRRYVGNVLTPFARWSVTSSYIPPPMIIKIFGEAYLAVALFLTNRVGLPRTVGHIIGSAVEFQLIIL